MKRNSVVALVIAGLLATTAQAAPLLKWRVDAVKAKSLGTLGGTQSVAYDINDFGNVVGWAQNAGGAERPFLYTAGVMQDIGPGPLAPFSHAYAINNSNVVTGGFWDAAGAHGFRWESGITDDLVAGPPVWSEAEAYGKAINDNDIIVGQTIYPDAGFFGFTEAHMWTDPGTHFALYPDPAASAFSTKVSDVDGMGRTVGWSVFGSEAFVWNPFAATPAQEHVPIPGPSTSIPGYTFQYLEPYGIHETGGVVGMVDFITTSEPNAWQDRAFIWDRHAPAVTTLGVLPGGSKSSADDLNRERFVVGWSNTLVLWPAHVAGTWESAFIWHRDFGMVALPRGANTNCRALALNERSIQTNIIQVVGWCNSGSGPQAVQWNVKVQRTLSLPFPFPLPFDAR